MGGLNLGQRFGAEGMAMNQVWLTCFFLYSKPIGNPPPITPAVPSSPLANVVGVLHVERQVHLISYFINTSSR